MNAIFCCRFPGEKEIHYHSGTFRSLKNHEKPNGFVVSNFQHDKIFIFEPDFKPFKRAKLHFQQQKPSVISRKDYQSEAQSFLNAFPLFAVEKGVYSRVKQEPFRGEKGYELFEALLDEYPTAYCYFISSPLFGTWIGATPELLLHQKGMLCNTVALASTHALDEESDWNEKEQNEHQFVVDAIQNTLENNACEEIQIDGPKEQIAGPVVHLRTDFQAILTKPNAWEIVNELHPTPAVCGTPRERAMEIISIRELHQRELYTGYIGWFEEGNTRLYVNLRCAQLQAEDVYLYVGGGFTIDSIPNLEWEETERKAETLLNLIKQIQ